MTLSLTHWLMRQAAEVHMRAYLRLVPSAAFLSACAVLYSPLLRAEDQLGIKQLQGRWQAVAVTKGGQSRTREEALAAKVIFAVDGDSYTYSVGGKIVEKGKLNVDGSKEPARLDLEATEGQDKGKRQLGIVRLRDGVLEMCLAPAGEDRPKEFSSPKGSQNNFGRFEKLK